MEVSDQFHAPAALFQGQSPCHLLDRRMDGPQSWSGRGDEEINSHPLSGLEPLIIQPVAERYTTELSRLLAFHFTVLKDYYYTSDRCVPNI
jgi:hypothetical protein